MASPTPINLGELAGGMTVSSFTVYCHDLSPYTVVQYLERYSGNSNGRRFAPMHRASNPKEILHVRTECMCDTPKGV